MIGRGLTRFSVIEPDLSGSRIGPAARHFLLPRQQFRIGDGGGDHLSPFFGMADGENFHSRSARFQEAKIFVHIFGVGQHVGRARNVT